MATIAFYPWLRRKHPFLENGVIYVYSNLKEIYELGFTENNIWTICHEGGDEYYILGGIHSVNAVGYYVTWEENIDYIENNWVITKKKGENPNKMYTSTTYEIYMRNKNKQGE